MAISIDELQHRCAWVSAHAILQAAENEWRIDPAFYFSKGTGDTMRAVTLRLMAEWLESAKTKDMLFAYVRWVTERNKYDCVISMTDAYITTSNERFMELPEEERKRLANDPKLMASLGYAVRQEAITVLGQAEGLVLAHSTPYERDPNDKSRISHFEMPRIMQTDDQHDATGRLVFSDPSPEAQKNFASFRDKIEGLGASLGREWLDRMDLSLSAPLVTITK